MIKLIESGLFGDQLIPVDKPYLVDRYNACLRDIGLNETKLAKFHIDGWGWSPEIAEEFGTRFYLSHGMANPYSIVISPDQENSSLYFPFHSFDWEIHREVFNMYRLQIGDITAQSGLWYELDQEISAYRSPQDMLMIEVINVQFKSTSNLMAAALEQKELVRRYYDEDLAWADARLRNRIRESSKQFGDLRFRDLEIPILPYSNIRAFYTSAFGGLYVIKKSPALKPIMIFENGKSASSGETHHAHIEFNLKDPQLIGFLYANRMINDSPQYFHDRIFLLEHQLDLMLVKAALKLDADLNLSSWNDRTKKALINRLMGESLVGDEYFELEEVIRKLKRREHFQLKADSSIRNHLLHPAAGLDEQSKTVVAQLLTNMMKNNELTYYTFNKPAFYTAYQEWSENYQLWVIDQLVENRGVYRKLIS